MAVRRPLVVVDGTVRELPSDSTVVATGAALPLYNTSGTQKLVSLTDAGEIPFVKTDGATSSDIPLVS